jgi:hypothetical protein
MIGKSDIYTIMRLQNGYAVYSGGRAEEWRELVAGLSTLEEALEFLRKAYSE